jgi:hypothetical protein
MHAHIHAHTCIHTYIHSYAGRRHHTHTYIHIHTHIYIHSEKTPHTHTYIHTFTYTGRKHHSPSGDSNRGPAAAATNHNALSINLNEGNCGSLLQDQIALLGEHIKRLEEENAHLRQHQQLCDIYGQNTGDVHNSGSAQYRSNSYVSVQVCNDICEF